MKLAPLTNRMTAYAQIILSTVFVSGYFFTLHEFMHGEVRVPTEFQDTLKTLLGALTAGVTSVLAYWFSRQRESRMEGNAGDKAS